MFPSGKKDAGDAVEYDGGRTSDDIVNWALEKLAENVPAPEPVEVGFKGDLKILLSLQCLMNFVNLFLLYRVSLRLE